MALRALICAGAQDMIRPVATMSGEIKLYLLFGAVKLAGYVLACVLLARYYRKPFSTGVVAGIVRTLIGMGIGALVFYGVTKGWGTGAVTNSPVLASLLAGVRVLEWTAVFWWFFRLDRKAFFMVPIAIVWSFALDLLGLFLFSGLIRSIIC
jgi:hypothetical protein